MDQNQERRRGHYHRGRRGPDRRGGDRRSSPPPQDRGGGRDQVDVEQIMREIRGRIAQRQGVELTTEQIQDLAARRLESILDPRAIRPSLLEALRRSAGAAPQSDARRTAAAPAYSFEDTTLYDSHRWLMRMIRRLLNPILKLFFNPNPLIQALHIQAKVNLEAAEREAERERWQTEWNALHYEIVQRLVTEVSRVSIDVQALSTKIESLDAKVDFNERRVRGVETSIHRGRPQGRPVEPQAASSVPVETENVATPAPGLVEPQSEGRRRRRRRRGRRSGAPGDPSAEVAIGAAEAVDVTEDAAGEPTNAEEREQVIAAPLPSGDTLSDISDGRSLPEPTTLSQSPPSAAERGAATQPPVAEEAPATGSAAPPEPLPAAERLDRSES